MVEASDRLAGWIETYVPVLRLHSGESPLFANTQARNASRRWGHSAFYTEWKRAAKRAGYPSIALYEGTKHSTATALRRAGVALDIIQAAAGHKDRRSTERYAQLDDNVVRDALRKRR